MARPKEQPAICTNCTWKPAFAKGLCRACYMYEYRHDGEPRPWSIIKKAAERENERRFI